MPVSIGVVFPEASEADVSPPDVASIARLAEQAGLDCIWAEDRLVAGEMCVPDCALTLAAAAAVTEHIGIGTAVYVPARRPLVWAAKEIASLQHIAGGRLQLGVGLGGGDEDEYEVAGFSRADRARRTDAFLRLLPDLLSGQAIRVPDLPGKPEVRLLPSAPLPPLWIGGTSPAALRRAAEFGSGWLSGFQTAGEFAASAGQLSELAAAAGRPGLRLGVMLHASLGPSSGRGLSDLTAGLLQRTYGVPPDRARQLAVGGSPDEVARQLAPFVAAGAEVFGLVCDPVPTPQSVDLLGELARHLRQP
jgi:alkanesulfonate monooxygenase SsuD/methylene tetrahydromethanopterin reductase-like flavin-dependent oxidoreductase (luciferase family)